MAQHCAESIANCQGDRALCAHCGCTSEKSDFRQLTLFFAGAESMEPIAEDTATQGADRLLGAVSVGAHRASAVYGAAVRREQPRGRSNSVGEFLRWTDPKAGGRTCVGA